MSIFGRLCSDILNFQVTNRLIKNMIQMNLNLSLDMSNGTDFRTEFDLNDRKNRSQGKFMAFKPILRLTQKNCAFKPYFLWVDNLIGYTPQNEFKTEFFTCGWKTLCVSQNYQKTIKASKNE